MKAECRCDLLTDLLERFWILFDTHCDVIGDALESNHEDEVVLQMIEEEMLDTTSWADMREELFTAIPSLRRGVTDDNC